MEAKIIDWEPLTPVITNHVLDKSIIKRNIPLRNLPREQQIKILEQRLIEAPILGEDDSIYESLKKGMPELERGERRYYKIDTSPEYPYIYIIKTNLEKKGKEYMVSIRWIHEFEERFSFKIKDTVH